MPEITATGPAPYGTAWNAVSAVRRGAEDGRGSPFKTPEISSDGEIACDAPF